MTLTLSLPSCATTAAPELLAGKRYCQDVDTFSFGAVMYEIAMRELPYHSDILKNQKKGGGKKPMQKMMKEISTGNRRPHLDDKPRECRKFGVGRFFKKRELSLGSGRVCANAKEDGIEGAQRRRRMASSVSSSATPPSPASSD